MTEQETRDAIEKEILEKVFPRLDFDKRNGGYNCCGCSSPDEIVDDILAIVKGAT